MSSAAENASETRFREAVTSAIVGLPIAIAAVFSLGGSLTWKAGKWAEAVTDGCRAVFLRRGLLNAIARLSFLAGIGSAVPTVIRSRPSGSSGPAGFAARPILPLLEADACLKNKANFWNAPCLTASRQRFEG